jgi:acetyl-CoA acetyltransferase
MSDVYVLGVDMIKFGRFPDRTVPDLGAEAALLALDDAELNIGNMETLDKPMQWLVKEFFKK